MRTSLLLLTLLSLPSFAAEPLKGTLKEKLDAAGYSYLRVETSAGERWAAVPQADVKVGAPVTIDVQTQMTNFESKTLKRTFPTIIFGNLEGATAAAKPVENPHPAGMPKTAPTAQLEGTVLETIDTTTYTYLRLKTASGETWAAVPHATVTKGSTVKVLNPSQMDGFRSPTLNRTFEHIVFGTL